LNGSGIFLGFGLEQTFTLSKNLSLVFGTGIERHQADFISPEQITLNIDGEPIEGLVHHNTELEIYFIPVQFGVLYEFKNDFLASLLIGSFNHISNSVTQFEELKEPDDRGVFPDTETRVRNRMEGVLKVSSFIPSIEIGLHKRLPLSMNSTSFLQLTGSINYIPIEIVENSGWKILTFKLKASFFFPI
jgi:hypothetical protein